MFIYQYQERAGAPTFTGSTNNVEDIVQLLTTCAHVLVVKTGLPELTDDDGGLDYDEPIIRHFLDLGDAMLGG